MQCGNFRTIYGGWEPSKNRDGNLSRSMGTIGTKWDLNFRLRVIVPAHQAAKTGELIPLN
jgi:hypothetical protein